MGNFNKVGHDEFPEKSESPELHQVNRTVFNIALSIIISVLFIGILMILSSSCTINLQTINTSGTAEDVVDEDMENDASLSMPLYSV